MSIPSAEHQHTTERLPVNSAAPSAATGGTLDVPLHVQLVRNPPTWLRVLAWCGVVLWCVTIFWFSSHTGQEIEKMNVFELSDKVAHFIAFFAGAPAFFLALRLSFGWTVRKTILICVLGLAVYGASDEYHQLYTPNRTGADVWDWTGDALGGLAGTLMCGLVYARLLRPKTPHRSSQAGD